MYFWNFSLIIKFPITALREIKILQSLNHKNIINLREIVNSQRNTFFSVFLFCLLLVFFKSNYYFFLLYQKNIKWLEQCSHFKFIVSCLCICLASTRNYWFFLFCQKIFYKIVKNHFLFYLYCVFGILILIIFKRIIYF